MHVVAMQCWKDSGSATEQFQRKSHKISHLYCSLGQSMLHDSVHGSPWDSPTIICDTVG